MTPRRLWCVVCASAVACHTPDIVVGDLQEMTVLRAIANRDLDLLFVIDNSPSMSSKQISLAENFPRMIDRLEQLDGGLPNLHLGVITSDMGTQGSAVATPGPGIGTVGQGGCAGVGDDGGLQHAGDPALVDGFVIDVAEPSGVRTRNYTGDLHDEFTRLARVGAVGCGFEQHLAAMRRAFTNPANAGFVRPGANLAVVILADEDDCSLLDPALLGADPSLGPLQSFRCFEHGVVCDPDAPRTPGDKRGCRPRGDATLVAPVAPFVAALLAVKPDPRQVMVAGIIGPPEPVSVTLAPPPGGITPVPLLAPSCVFDGAAGAETADPAVRLAAFLDSFPGRTQRTTICNGDLGSSLDAIGETAKRLVGDPCIDTAALADTSPDPGVQPACDVTDVSDAAPDQPISLPACSGAAAGDCYTLAPDTAACPDGDHLRLRLSRASAADLGTWTHVRCQRAR